MADELKQVTFTHQSADAYAAVELVGDYLFAARIINRKLMPSRDQIGVLVDYGCGAGKSTRAVAGSAREGGKVVGVDISTAMLDNARLCLLRSSELEDSMFSALSESSHAVSRRRFFNGVGVGAAAILSSSAPVWADADDRPSDPFIVLLKGLYRPAPQLPDLGLSGVNLSDTSYMKTKIYPVFGVPGSEDQDDAIGRFYVSFGNPVCIYDLPHGAIAMQFAGAPVFQDIGFNALVPFPDGNGGVFLEGTFELSILDATGIYKRFKGGHNHMVDRLHLDATGTKFTEFCFCNISSYQFP